MISGRSFDRIAEQYAAEFFDELDRKPFDRDLLRRFARAPRGPGLVLEVGCGPGHVGRFLAQAGVPVVGLDISAGMLHVAARLNAGRPFVAGDMRALPLRPGSMAGLVAFDAVVYWDAATTLSILNEFRRVLRPGAPLLLAVHAGRGRERFTEYRGTPVDITLHYHEPAELAGALRLASFGVDEVVDRPAYPFEHPTGRLYIAARAA